MTTTEIEQRLSAVEHEIAELKAQLARSTLHAGNWVESIAGTFANDPIFDEAARLGKKWREAENKKSLRQSRVRGSKRRK